MSFPSFGDQVADLVQQGFFLRQPVTTARAPGRLDLMGGNVDYTGGLVLQLPLHRAVWAAFQRCERPTLRILNLDAPRFGWQDTLEFPIAELGSLESIWQACDPAEGTGWGRYVLGGFHLLQQRYGCFADSGGSLVLASDLPPNRGLASSAAVEIAVLKAVAAEERIALDGVKLAEYGQWVENIVARSACGIMDQAVIVLGEQDSLLPILCQPCTPLPPLRLPETVRVWAIDSLVPRATSSGAYEAARAASFMGYRMICEWAGLKLTRDATTAIPRWTDPRWNGYLSNLRPSEFRSRWEARLPESLAGREFLRCFEHIDPLTVVDPDAVYAVRAAVRYASEENFRIETVRLLLANLDGKNLEPALRLIGELLLESHHAYAECGLGATACDELVAMAQQFGFPGAKMTGGGCGGVVAILGLAGQEDAFQQLAAEYARKCCAAPATFSGSSDGADRFGTASIEPATVHEVCKGVGT